MREAVRLLTRLNGLSDITWFSIEVRILAGKPTYILVQHFFDGPDGYTRTNTLADLNKIMSAYIRQYERTQGK